MNNYINSSPVGYKNTITSLHFEQDTDIIDINSDTPNLNIQEKKEDLADDCLKKTAETINKNKKNFSFTDGTDYSFDDSFDTEIKLSGYIKEIDFDNKNFIVLMNNTEDGFEREFKISFSDIEKNDIEKIDIGARIVYIYGKHYIRGTAYNASKIIFRVNNTWNKYKLKKLDEETKTLLSMIKTDAISS